MDGMYISGEVRSKLISLVSDGVEVYTQALNDPRSGFASNEVKRLRHLSSLNNLIELLDYLKA